MGYRSDVRIITSKKGFKELNKYVKKYLKDKGNLDYNLLDNLEIKFENDFSYYFGWNYLKWYDGYDSVDAIMSGLEHLKEKNMSYRFARMGENCDDFEEHDFESEKESEQDFEYPSIIRQFDDEYVIGVMGKCNSNKEKSCDEL